MAKLRKMLGKIDEAACVALMRLIETQSKQTLAQWAVRYARENYLPIYEAEGRESCFAEAIAQCEAYFAGTKKLTEIKPALKAAREASAKVDGPTEQAAARAIATACAVALTPTNALGYLFYGAAAFAYRSAGLEETGEVYDALATRELERALASLEEVAVKDEPNPAKINWNC